MSARMRRTAIAAGGPAQARDGNPAGCRTLPRRRMHATTTARAVALTLLLGACAAPGGPRPPGRWQQVVVDAKFRSEAVAAADVDRDGDLDLLVGDFWYRAPEFAPCPIRAAKDHGDGSASYSKCFACWADDVDGDGWTDQIVVGMPGAPATWLRNPGADGLAKGALWAEFVVHPSACNESPAYVDLFGDGDPVLLMGDGGSLLWLAPGADPTQPWPFQPVSGPEQPAAARYAHGLGVGDLDGDGRRDVLSAHGWWSQPQQGRAAAGPWPANLQRVAFDSAHLHACDVDGDGRVDVLASSAHARGIWWNANLREPDGSQRFAPRTIAEHVTQTHALAFADVDGDGREDLITGKRWWAHGPQGDVDPMAEPWLGWIALGRGAEPTFTTHTIDVGSGAGTCFVARDLDGDGRLDVAVANKRGVRVFFARD